MNNAARRPRLPKPLALPLKLLPRIQALLAADLDIVLHLPLESGHPNHEELVEIVGRNREEPEPL